MDLDFSFIGWVHSLLCIYSLAAGAFVLWRVKGGELHRAAGRQYAYAMAGVNLSALGIFKLGAFNVFHVMALATLVCLAVAFAVARWKTPRRAWLRIHLTSMIVSYYMLVGGLVNEAFVRITALREQQAMLGVSHSAVMLVFLLLISYFWGKTAHGNIIVQSSNKQMAVQS